MVISHNVTQVHNLCTAGRFRSEFDNFWNLGASLQAIDGYIPRFIGLTATLRQDDVPDIMNRMAIHNAVVFRRSCFRSELQFETKVFGTEEECKCKAVALASLLATGSTVLVIATSINLCEDIGLQLTVDFPG
jgi:superfamily II DNA helicase RecQ